MRSYSYYMSDDRMYAYVRRILYSKKNKEEEQIEHTDTQIHEKRKKEKKLSFVYVYAL